MKDRKLDETIYVLGIMGALCTAEWLVPCAIITISLLVYSFKRKGGLR